MDGMGWDGWSCIVCGVVWRFFHSFSFHGNGYYRCIHIHTGPWRITGVCLSGNASTACGWQARSPFLFPFYFPFSSLSVLSLCLFCPHDERLFFFLLCVCVFPSALLSRGLSLGLEAPARRLA